VSGPKDMPIPSVPRDVMSQVAEDRVPDDTDMQQPDMPSIPHIDDDATDMQQPHMPLPSTPPALHESGYGSDTPVGRELRYLEHLDRQCALDEMEDMLQHVDVTALDTDRDGTAAASAAYTEVDDGETEVDSGDAAEDDAGAGLEEAALPLQRTRKNPPRHGRGVKNEPKAKVAPPRRATKVGKKRTRAELSPSPTREEFDIRTPIVVKVHRTLPKRSSSPSKKVRKATVPARRDAQSQEVGTRERSRVILNNFGKDLKSLLYHLNYPRLVSFLILSFCHISSSLSLVAGVRWRRPVRSVARPSEKDGVGTPRDRQGHPPYQEFIVLRSSV
jgi:hypothetical protein